jgi:formylmethanofuran dehydrogenase subunit E
MNKEFDEVVGFHKHLCLDIAVGYRAAKAAMREMGDQVKDMKSLVAMVGNETCAIDAVQEVTGCTFGKRNLYLTHIGKPVYTLLNTKSGKGVRVYANYWEKFDHKGFGKKRKEATAPTATADQRAAYEKELKETIDWILSAPEPELISIRQVTLPPPPKSGKYEAEPCAHCGEHANTALLVEKNGQKLCKECAG